MTRPTSELHMVNGFDPTSSVELLPSSRDLIERRTRVLGPAYRLFYERPVEFVRGEGVLLFDTAGADYLDVYNNVPVVGHSNPRVRAAVAEQLGVLNTHTRYLTSPIVEYAERLVGLFPSELGQVIFACTGSEAVDLSLRIARHETGARGVVITGNAYHGTTQAAAEISPSLGPNNTIPRTVITVPAPDPLREGEGAADRFLAQVVDAIAELKNRGVGFAGLIVDSVLSSDGLQLEPAGFLAPVVDVVHREGGLYIADEVQPGFGRTGAHWWGFQRHGVVPDLVVLGKPMGNGIPISAVVARPEVLTRFGADVRYFNTFAGSPVSIAAATSVLDEIEERDLLDSATRVGTYLSDSLLQLAAEHPGIAAVRGAGLFLGVEFVTDPSTLTPDAKRALDVVNQLRERRILISASGPGGNVLKIRPPLVFERNDADRFLTEFAAVLESTS
ncbi:MAG: aspartate aminotransferase family protein [Rhodoglobus sp.]